MLKKTIILRHFLFIKLNLIRIIFALTYDRYANNLIISMIKFLQENIGNKISIKLSYCRKKLFINIKDSLLAMAINLIATVYPLLFFQHRLSLYFLHSFYHDDYLGQN